MGARNADLFDRYVWLIDTIRRYRRITSQEINECWKRSHLGYGDDLPWCTLMDHKKVVADIFNVYIECDAKDDYKYYIDHQEDLEGDGLRLWLVDSYATLNQLRADHSLEHRIQSEEMPSGSRFLTRILEAMHFDRVLKITHQGFGKGYASTFEVEPCVMKIYDRRWYFVGRSPYYDDIRTYSLNRIQEIEVLERMLRMPDDFDINALFEGCASVIADKKIDVEHVVIKTYDYARKYLATLPIHPSQKEITRDDESTTFSYDVRPNYEFLQALLMQVDQTEVVELESVRKQVRNIAKNSMHIYK